MKQTVTLAHFRDTFTHADRGNNFTYEGLELLFGYLEEIDPDYELDVVELCCGYSESTEDDIRAQYKIDTDDVEEVLQDNTAYIGRTPSGFVYQDF